VRRGGAAGCAMIVVGGWWLVFCSFQRNLKKYNIRYSGLIWLVIASQMMDGYEQRQKTPPTGRRPYRATP